jgi:hypothetical protein
MEAKTAVLGALVIAGVAGYFLLKNGSLKVAHNSESAVAPEDASSGAD